MAQVLTLSLESKMSSSSSSSSPNFPAKQINKAQHTLTLPLNENDESCSLLINLCDQSSISSLSCSVDYQVNRMKRTHKSMNLNSYGDLEDEHELYDQSQELIAPNKRRRGASYNIVEIHSLLHLMKRVLPKCADEWEIIRIVHGRIFPNNDRTVSSLKKKFRDLCRETKTSKREVEKAKEVQKLISLKPPGYQLVLGNPNPPATMSNSVVNSSVLGAGQKGQTQLQANQNLLNSLPNFKVRVPNPLQPVTSRKHVPEYIQIPESPPPGSTTGGQTNQQDDDMSALDLDDHEPIEDEFEPITVNNEQDTVIIAGPVGKPIPSNATKTITFCGTDLQEKKSYPAIIFDHK